MVDSELDRVARRRQNLRLVWVLLAGVLCWLLALVWWIQRSTTREGRPPWEEASWARQLAVVSIPLVIVLVELAVLLWLRRRGVRWLQPDAALGLDRSERRRLIRAIRQNEHLPGRDGELARGIATTMVRQRWVLPLVAISLVCTAAYVVLRARDAIAGLMAIAALLLVISLPFILRDVRRARRYLEHDQSAP